MIRMAINHTPIASMRGRFARKLKSNNLKANPNRINRLQCIKLSG